MSYQIFMIINNYKITIGKTKPAMVQNIQSFSPPPFQAGGFNLPTGSQQIGAGNTTPVNNAFAAMGQNSTLNGTNPTTQFNNTATSALQMYANMGFDKNTQALLGVANNFLDPMKVASNIGITPQVLTQGLGGYTVAMGNGMSSMALNIALDGARNAIQTDPATGQPKDAKGFMSLMASMSKDPGALLRPEFQQLVPTYQAMMGTISTQSNAIAAGANAAQAQQMAQIQQQLNQLAQSQQAIMAIITDSKGLEGLSASDLATKLALAMQSGSAATPSPTTTTGTPALSTQQHTQALFKNQTKSATTT
jgi:hypothetical protein